MQRLDIHLADLAPWRALLTRAQFTTRIELHGEVEEYVLGVLFRATEHDDDLTTYLAEIPRGLAHGVRDADDLRELADRCLVHAGLYPERAMADNIPLAYFVDIGTAAYRECARVFDDALYLAVADLFTVLVGLLHALREADTNEVCLDPLNAYELWCDTGSAHAWRTLARFTAALPAPQPGSALN